MKYIRPFVFFLLGAISFTHVACNDPTVIGSDLLNDDQLDVRFIDTLTLKTYNAPVDSVLTYNPSGTFNVASFPIGRIADPIFGLATSSVYFLPTLNVSFPDFADPAFVLDSVVLSVPYSAENSYGNFDDFHSLEVYQMAEPFPDTSLYSNMEYPLGDLIGTTTYQPRPEDSVKVYSALFDTIVTFSPQLRITLDIGTFAKDLFAIDSVKSTTASEFEAFLKGICIKPVSENQGMPSFTFRTTGAGLTVFYHRDTVFFEYKFPIFSGNVVTANFKHDRSTSVIGLDDYFIGENADFTDSLLFLQGMSGTNVVLEIPYATALTNIVVNKAELELPIRFLMEDEMDYYPPAALVFISEILEDGSFRVIDDITFAIRRVGADNYTEIFGGDVEPDNTYRLNISSHFQDMVRGLVTNKMVITVSPKAEQAARTVLGGPGNSDATAKLNVTYTNF